MAGAWGVRIAWGTCVGACHRRSDFGVRAGCDVGVIAVVMWMVRQGLGGGLRLWCRGEGYVSRALSGRVSRMGGSAWCDAGICMGVMSLR